MLQRILTVVVASSVILFAGCTSKGGHHAAQAAVKGKQAGHVVTIKANSGPPTPSYGPLPAGGTAGYGYIQCQYDPTSNDAKDHPTLWHVGNTSSGPWNPGAKLYWPFSTNFKAAVNANGSRDYWVAFTAVNSTDTAPANYKVTVYKNYTVFLTLPPYQ